MDLQVNGRCVKVFDQRFTSKKDGSEHVKHNFVIETQDGQWVKKICFTVFGDERWTKMGVASGRMYNVSFDLSSREWNNSFITEATAWRVVPIDNQQQAPAPAQPQVQPTQSGQKSNEDVPF
jgi:hypothetical protein